MISDYLIDNFEGVQFVGLRIDFLHAFKQIRTIEQNDTYPSEDSP